MSEHIGVPTVQGFKTGLKNTAWGAAGGAVFGLSTQLTGNGLLGGLISSGLTAAVIKGQTGETISTVIGFEMGKSLFSGGGEKANASPSAVMV